MAIEGEYPILEYLILMELPEIDCSIPMRSPLLGTVAGPRHTPY